MVLAEDRGQLTGLVLAFRKQREVGVACVTSVASPLGGSMSQEPELTLSGHGQKELFLPRF